MTNNYIGLRFGSNSDDNRFTENIFAHNLHPVETGGSDVSGTRWAVNGVGNFWGDDVELDLDRDGINDLPHRELDLFGVLRRDFPAIAFLSDSPALKLLRFAHERAAIPRREHDRRSALAHFAILENARAARRGHISTTMIATEHLDKALRPQAGPARTCQSVAKTGEITLLVGPNGAGKTHDRESSRRTCPAKRRKRAHQFLRRCSRPNRSAARAFLSAAATKFSSASHVCSRSFAFTRGCAASACRAAKRCLTQTGLREFERVRTENFPAALRQRLGRGVVAFARCAGAVAR